MSWLTEGPLAQFRDNHPGLVRGAQVGGAPGAVAGALYDWGASRGWWGSSNGPIQSQGLANTMQDRQIQATQDQIWGNTDVPIGDRTGPPPSMAGMAGVPTQDQGSAPAWYEDTTTNAADPLGLVPEYDNGSTGQLRQGDRGPQARRDGIFSSTGPRSDFVGTVTDMRANGEQVILGSGDPNQRYRNRGTDFGG